MAMRQKITPFLWFDGKAAEAARFYISVFGNGSIVEENPVVTVFELEGHEFAGINGGPQFKFTEAVSFAVRCGSQAEIDHFWNRLTADGGCESMCGWLRDRYGLSWQIIPERLKELIGGEDRNKAERAAQAMLKMRKIIIADLEAAAAG